MYLVKHGLRSGQRVFLQGLLRKEGSELVLKCGKRSDLVISTQSIEEEQINNRKSGTYLLILGSMLVAGGIYRFLNSDVFSIHVTKPNHEERRPSLLLLPLPEKVKNAIPFGITASPTVCSQTIT